MSPLQGIVKGRESLEDVARLIGNVVVHFALFERGLAELTATAYHRLGGNRLEPDMPASLPKDLTFLAKAARRLPELASDRPELLWIADEATRLSSLRHDIVNGYITGYDPGGHQPLRFAWMRADRDTRQVHEVILRRITTDELARAGDDTADLARRTARLAARLLTRASAPEQAS
jgi:hypothetical protein